MNRKEVKDFLETLYFHGYIDHDVTKLDRLIDDYYPKQCDKADVIKSVCDNKCQCQDAVNFNRLICPLCTPM